MSMLSERKFYTFELDSLLKYNLTSKLYITNDEDLKQDIIYKIYNYLAEGYFEENRIASAISHHFF
jgi:hypothetical protein